MVDTKLIKMLFKLTTTDFQMRQAVLALRNLADIIEREEHDREKIVAALVGVLFATKKIKYCEDISNLEMKVAITKQEAEVKAWLKGEKEKEND